MALNTSIRSGIVGVVAVLLPLTLAAPVDAQDLPLEFEGRIGAAVPVGDVTEDLSTGLSFGASIGYRVVPMVTVYGGYTQNNFGTTGDWSYNTGGFDLGARVNLAAPGLNPWLRGGLVFHRAEPSGTGIPGADRPSDYSLGFEVGGGLGFRVGDMISITPGIRYTTFSPRWDGDAANGSVDAVVIDVGARVSL